MVKTIKMKWQLTLVCCVSLNAWVCFGFDTCIPLVRKWDGGNVLGEKKGKKVYVCDAFV